MVALEANVQSWTRGNFSDALAAGYGAWTLRQEGRLAGFCILMFAPDVAHLLVIAVARDLHRQGLGGELMHWCEQRARERGLEGVLLEVSNASAIAFYRSTAICRSACAVAITGGQGRTRGRPGHAKAFRRERSLSMNAVRSPEDIMPAIPPAGAAAPRVNPLQRIWLREIGMEKLWLKPAPAARQVDAQVVDLKKEASVRPARAERSDPARRSRCRCSGAASRPRRAGRAARVAPACAAGPPPAGRQAGAGSRRGPLIPVAERARNATLDELREQVVSCTACGLCQGRRHAVFGHGGQPARWLVVGEAPGEQEDRQGQPFVGRSGQLLDAMLSAVGMSRERDVFIANVIKCRPPGNRNPSPRKSPPAAPT